MRPPRPAAATASAVLLMIVGYQVVFLAVLPIFLFLRLTAEDVGADDFRTGAVVLALATALFALLATKLLVVAYRTLDGNLVSPRVAGFRIASLGFLLTGLAALVSCGYSARVFRGLATLGADPVVLGRVMLLGLMLYGAINLLWVVIAGTLLHRSANRYTAWQEVIRRLPEDDEDDAARVGG